MLICLSPCLHFLICFVWRQSPCISLVTLFCSLFGEGRGVWHYCSLTTLFLMQMEGSWLDPTKTVVVGAHPPIPPLFPRLLFIVTFLPLPLFWDRANGIILSPEYETFHWTKTRCLVSTKYRDWCRFKFHQRCFRLCDQMTHYMFCNTRRRIQAIHEPCGNIQES